MSDVLGMSDEDFLKQQGPDGDSASESSTDEQILEQTPESSEPETPESEASSEEAVPETSPEEEKTDSSEPNTEGVSAEGEASSVGSEDKNEAVETPNYESFYKQIMTPFKANGKMIELHSPEEAIQLMQMGANYTRKMQELAPHRKMLMMLEKNGLLSEEKLSFFIDIEKKNPEAIKKLIKDSGVDPLEIDTSTEPNYQAGNHQVGDDEVLFNTTLDEVRSADGGTDTLKIIHNSWDTASKEILWKSPEIMRIIHEQRASGVYDRITSEMDRQRTLGKIGADVPFLHAYKAVGDELVKANAFADLAPPASNSGPATVPPAQGATKPPAVVATRVAAPKPAVTNGDKVKAASATRANPTKAEKFVNPLAMSDEEFLKQMEGRL